MEEQHFLAWDRLLQTTYKGKISQGMGEKKKRKIHNIGLEG